MAVAGAGTTCSVDRRASAVIHPMDRRLFLALAGASLAAPQPVRAWPVPVPLRRLNLVNVHTGETFDGPYRDDTGPIGVAMDDLSVFLRDHHSGEKIAIDIGVLDFLASVMDAVGATRATVLSAYRTRETNAMLARTTFGVADNSQHIYGRALDVHLARLDDAMEAARKMERGGVGWYPHSGFIHLDSGPVRTWTLDARDGRGAERRPFADLDPPVAVGDQRAPCLSRGQQPEQPVAPRIGIDCGYLPLRRRTPRRRKQRPLEHRRIGRERRHRGDRR